MAKPFLTPEELSERWSLPLTTLSQWRWTGKGPEFSKMGKRARYALEAVEEFEKRVLKSNTCNSKNNLYPNIKFKKQ